MIQEVENYNILNNIPLAIGITDISGKIIYINQKFIELFGYHLNDIPDVDTWSIIAYPNPAYREEVIKNWNDDIDKLINKNIQSPSRMYTITCHDKTVKSIEISFNYVNNILYVYFHDLTELSTAHSILKRENIFTNKIINSLPGIFYLFQKINNNYSLKLWNKNFELVSGYTAEELKDKNITNFFREEQAAILSHALARLENEGFFGVELKIRSKESKLIPYLFNAYSFNDDKQHYVIGTATDINQVKEIHESLEKNRIFTKKITEQSPNFIYIFDVDEQENVYINRDLGAYLGYSEDELPGKTLDLFKLLIHPDDLIMFDNLYHKIDDWDTNYLEEFEYRIKAKSGEWRWFRGQEKEFQRKNGKVKSILGTISDVTDSKKNQIALIESEEKYRTLIETFPDILFVSDYSGLILFANKSFNLLTGNVNNEFPANGEFALRVHPDDADYVSQTIQSFIQSNNSLSELIVNRYIDYEGKTHWFSRIITKIMFEGKPALQTIGRNITQLKNIEKSLRENELILLKKNEEYQALNEELKQSYEELKSTNEALQNARLKAEESDILKTAFLQNMSHEIRTPLNGILGFTSLIIESGINDEQKKYYSKIINDSSDQLINIVDDIISISKIETGQSEILKNEVNLNRLINEIIEHYNIKANEKSIQLFLNVNSTSYNIILTSDEGKLWQILNNLINNAIKFTSYGSVEVGFMQEYRKIKFWVKDTGIGIAKENHNKIFERFRQIDLDMTRTYGGTGLGLTIAKANAELLGGNIWVESEINKGSAFYFYIPYLPIEKKEQFQEKEDTQVPVNKKLTILVAEDEEINLLFLEEVLADFGANVVSAVNGKEAVDMACSNYSIDLVLLDIKMPEMSGYEALDLIKAKRPELPVIAQTAYAFISDRQKALNAGFNDYISKPIKKKDLLDIIKKYQNE